MYFCIVHKLLMGMHLIYFPSIGPWLFDSFNDLFSNQYCARKNGLVNALVRGSSPLTNIRNQ